MHLPEKTITDTAEFIVAECRRAISEKKAPPQKPFSKQPKLNYLAFQYCLLVIKKSGISMLPCKKSTTLTHN